jgi:hypothetical protein
MSKPIVLIAGGTGLIGSRLASMLEEKKYAVRRLTRHPVGPNDFFWDPGDGKLDEKALEGVLAVINLAGAGIAEKRWTPRRKKILIESRVQGTKLLREAFMKKNTCPEAYLSASAIGYYGETGEKWMYEPDPPADQSFMVRCCTAWEEGAEAIAALGSRTVVLRIGIVLAKEGGALPELMKPIRFGIGGYFADGQAWYSWIHRDDLCHMFIWALENQAVDGIFNAVSPHPVRNKELIRSVAAASHRKVLMIAAPAFALRLALGEMSATILNSNLVSCDKIRGLGFHFQYSNLDDALREIFQK